MFLDGVVLFGGGFGFVFDFAGVGLFGAVYTVGGMETWAQHLLLTLTVAATHRLDDIIKT